MSEVTPHGGPAKAQSMYLDVDRARSLALREQDAVLGCRKRVLATMHECPVLDSGCDEATVAINEAVALVKELVSDQEDAVERATLDVLHKTFVGIDLTAGTDFARGDDIARTTNLIDGAVRV